MAEPDITSLRAQLRPPSLPRHDPTEPVESSVIRALTRSWGIRATVKKREPDLDDLPGEVRDKLEIHLVSELGEVLALTLRGATFREGRLLFGDEKNPRDVVPLSAAFRH